MKEIYDFLTELEMNNNREWFDKNRDTYQKTKNQFLQFTDVLINELRIIDPEIPSVDPKKCVFRLFRDVRFSHDKRPYKTNYGCFISRDGRKGGNPGYYFHIQPGNSFLGGGIYMPMPDKLKAIRTEIYNYPSDIIKIIEDPEFKESFDMYNDDKLKTAPRGFPKGFEHIDLLRYKSYAPFTNVSDELLLSPDLITFILSKYKLLSKFNQFLNHAIDQ